MDALNAMAAVLRNFKNIPCPSGNSCDQPNCQWKHSWETEPAVDKSEATETGENDNWSGPRKRQRVDEAGRNHRSSSHSNGEIELTTATKSVSPPPLKRKHASQLTDTQVKLSQPVIATNPSASMPVKATSHTKGVTATIDSPIPTPSSVNHSLAVKPVVKAPRKPEALNPRHLKSSPATHEFRYKVLRMLHEQLVRLNNELKKDANDEEEKLVLTDQELIWLALDKEEHAATDKPPIYSNVIKNRIMDYKKKSVIAWKEERLAELKKEAVAVSSMQVANRPPLGPPRVVETGLTPEQEVAFLHKIVTPIRDLARYNYVPTAPAEPDLENARLGVETAKGWEECDRCGTRFQVFPEGRRESDGALTSGGRCSYHPGKKYRPTKSVTDRSEGTQPAQRWSCCDQDVNTAGCSQSNTHVFKTTDPSRLALVMPFAETPPNPSAPTDRAVCFDCEMGYTVKGLELLRLTATSWPDGRVLLDVLVQPIGEILDFNSRYSGVFPESFAAARPFPLEEDESSPISVPDQPLKEGEVYEPHHPRNQSLMKVSSPYAARDLLFSLISPTTPLIGHAIENDLGAVRVIHPTVIDTVLLFPHPRRLPNRFGLKGLMMTHLNKAIQLETAEQQGHDSAEDARSAGELVRFKVMTEWDRLKREGWTVEGTEFLSPGKRGALTEEFIEKRTVANRNANRVLVVNGSRT